MIAAESDAGIRLSVFAESALVRACVRYNFTAEECKVAFLLVRGYSDKEIAARRGTSRATVYNQVRAMMHKADRLDRVSLALELAGAFRHE